jgi:NAD(P)-dependent dehydrogenase (short-subunit alcohol dehydrogenase family)
MQLFDLSGRVAVITGGNGGIGLGMAKGMAAAGATIVVAGRDAAKNGAAVKELEAAGGKAQAIPVDVLKEDSCRALIDQTIKAHGRLDILVNDVGGGTSGHIWEAKVEDWDFILRLNLRSAFLCTREAAAHMRERRYGRIINLSSGAREGTPWTAYYVGNSAYSAAKAGIHGFTRGVALELAEYGVTVNAVAPGPIETEKTAPSFRKLEPLEYGPVRATPLRRIGVPADIANAVLYLASDEANYITGTTLAVAGGR